MFDILHENACLVLNHEPHLQLFLHVLAPLVVRAVDIALEADHLRHVRLLVQHHLVQAALLVLERRNAELEVVRDHHDAIAVGAN